MQQAELNQLATRFERFAIESASQGSEFYCRLSRHVAANDELLELASHAFREPIPNTLLGAVHFLLLQNPNHVLGKYYSSLTDEPWNDEHLFDTFSNFCKQFKDELIAVISERLVQTNEINRCAILSPAFSTVYSNGKKQPLALVEIGASAGLNLLWDNYRIEYSDGTAHGNSDSPVLLECEMRGARLTVDCLKLPTVRHRVGVDFNPIDLSDAEERTWLQALVWPDQRERAMRLDSAIALAMKTGLPDIHRGDALESLPAILATVPDGQTTCVFNSSVLYMFTPEDRGQLVTILSEASAKCPIWHVSAESEEGLLLCNYRSGALVDERLLADFDAHGRWLNWRD